jgi:hypothetical protein
MRNYLISLFLFATSLGSPALAQTIDAKWTVTQYAGETWFAKPAALIGKTQEFHKGFAKGVFYFCNFEGQSATYNSYTMAEFLANKEFGAFDKFKDQLGLRGARVFVHRVTCNGKSPETRRVLYPFVTVEPGRTAYYLFEGAVYKLRR